MNIRNKIQLFKYYMRKDPNQPVLIMRIILDILFINSVVWILIYLYIVYKTKSPMVSALLSLAIVVLLDIGLFINKRSIYNTNRKNRRREIVIKHLSHRISQLNEQEFQLQLIKILLNCKGFSNIYKEKGLLKANYNNTSVAIGFHHPPPEEETPFSKVWEFILQAKSLGFNKGFFFTSSTYEENCNKKKIGNIGFSLNLMDAKYILDRMEEAGMFPDESAIDQLIAGEIRKEKIMKQKVKYEVFNSTKSKQYLFVSVVFLFCGVLFKSFRFYCLSVSLIFSILAFLIKLLISESHDISESSNLLSSDDTPDNL